MEPNLKIVPRTQIVPIMESNADRADYLTTAFAEAGHIFNPLLVIKAVDDIYLLTDDGSYLDALKRLSVDFIPVQVASVPNPPVMTGHIFLGKWDDNCFREFQRIFPRDAQIMADDSADPKDRVYARTKFGEGIALGSSRRASGTLVDFIAYLRQKAAIVRPNARNRAVTDQKTGLAIVEMEFGNIGLRDVLKLGQSGFRFPSGFCRAECPCRVLGINYPIKVLKEKASVEDKQTFLHELIMLRMESGRAESFNGGVLLLNY